MMRQLDEAILRARFDDSVHVIVLRGHGDKFFSAGANIGMLNTVTPRFKYFFCLHANETLNRLEQTPKLTIAALNGHTVGGGLEIAMACDIRLAKENAGKIGLPEVNLGVLPGTGGTQRMARILGKSLSIELMVKGELFSFDRAKEIGLVNEIFPAKEFWEQVPLCQTILPAPQGSSGGSTLGRSIGRRDSVQSALAIERSCSSCSKQDAKGIAVKSGKRVAEFKRGGDRSLLIMGGRRLALPSRTPPRRSPGRVAAGEGRVDRRARGAACFESPRGATFGTRGAAALKAADLLEARLGGRRSRRRRTARRCSSPRSKSG